MKQFVAGILLSCTLVIAGCGGTKQTAGTDVVRVLSTTQEKGAVVVKTQSVQGNANGEDVVDLSSHDGLQNYLHAEYPELRDYKAKVILPNGSVSEQTISSDTLTRSPVPQVGASASSALGAAVTGAMSVPPRGCRMDPKISPRAGLSAPHASKASAVVSVAVSKMGTPYIWGHNEDRGQFGFDCSNFTAYVYHHALGYIMSGSSQTQNTSVGNPVPKSQMQTGDLLIFDNGGHVGIYAGNNQVIQEGGGLKKVGYLNISPGKYWANHITSVRRMF